MTTHRDLAGWTVAFDLDGTIVETAPDLIATLNRMLEQRNLPHVPLESGQHLIGHGALALLRHGFMEAGAIWDEAAAPALLDAFIADYSANIAVGSRPYAGVVETLDRLAARGAILCVATNKRTDLSRTLLEALGLTRHFAAICGPESVSARKPDGAHVREAVLQAGGDPARAIMVGDGAPDAQAARHAGVPCVVVTFGYTQIPPADLGGDILIDRFDQLEEAVDRLVGGIERLRPAGDQAMSPPPRLMDA